MSLSNLIRLSGLAAVLSGVLFIIADLVTVGFAFGGGTPEASTDGLLFRSTLGAFAVVLLLWGLVGLYAPRSEALGILGFVGFLAAFAGLGLQWGSIWASLLANLGWVLFGAASLAARAYPRAAVGLLIVGAVLSGVVNALLGSGSLPGYPGYVVGVMVVDIVFYAAVAWLGISLFTRRNEGIG